MALWDKLIGELVDIVEWLDDTHDTLAYRFERYQNEIKYGAKLVVREGQMAVFVNEGKLADVFKPGTYKLTTQNMPILATLRGLEVRLQQPVQGRGVLRLHAQVHRPQVGHAGPGDDARQGFRHGARDRVRHLRDPREGSRHHRAATSSAPKGASRPSEIQENLRGKIGLRIKELMPELGIPVIEMSRRRSTRWATALRDRLQPDFEAHGPRAGRGAGAGHRAAGGSREGDRQARRHGRRRQPPGVHAVRDRPRRSAMPPTIRAARRARAWGSARASPWARR